MRDDAHIFNHSLHITFYFYACKTMKTIIIGYESDSKF